MSETTGIQWTDATWNPCLGCSKISPGCKGCYAIEEVWRMAHNPSPKIAAANAGLVVIQGDKRNWTGKVRLIPERLEIPLHWKNPRRVFVNSLSDLFHEELSDEDIDRVFATMALAPQHQFQVLTKRSARTERYMASRAKSAMFWKRACPVGWTFDFVSPLDGQNYSLLPFPLPNVWLGVSVESRDYLDRIDHLRRTPAAVRFLSLEPLLEDLGTLDLTGIHWVIVGGESGPGARPMHPQWVRNIREQCIAAGVPFFFKQWGEWNDTLKMIDKFNPLYGKLEQRHVLLNAKNSIPCAKYVRMTRLGKKKAGRELDGRTWDEMPTPTP
jgi:protein gp37